MTFDAQSKSILVYGAIWISSYTYGELWSLSSGHLEFDFDSDCIVGLADWSAFQNCFLSPSRSRCMNLDSDKNKTVDLSDMRQFFLTMSGR